MEIPPTRAGGTLGGAGGTGTGARFQKDSIGMESARAQGRQGNFEIQTLRPPRGMNPHTKLPPPTLWDRPSLSPTNAHKDLFTHTWRKTLPTALQVLQVLRSAETKR
jgi:hypothetical protein